MKYIQPSFSDDIEQKTIWLDKLNSWPLPKVIEGSYPLSDIEFEVDEEIAPYISLDKQSLVVTFNGKGIKNYEKFS